ncbi:hypothetical protein [uncultured Vibrio sp.]|uniref:hypothetical protein n=1 Tax=uncultured Vibrio sp. TaxID=114054 RepID=UPI0025E68559|nr:hypothetical protein [uncultured Vibrio sp.]
MPKTTHTLIDIPFEFRHSCWFCGEPSSALTQLPHASSKGQNVEHAPLEIPSCSECNAIKAPKHVRSIWALRSYINQALITKYAKHLGIGENWTKQELIDSDFSGAILGGFGNSAWKMYEIAKQRISYQGWALSLDGLPLDSIDDTAHFTFEGTHYTSVNHCIDYFVTATGIDKDLLEELVSILSVDRFGYALKIARLNKRLSSSQRSQIVEEVRQQEAEQQEALQIREMDDFESRATSSITEVTVSGVVVPVFAIQWAIENRVNTLNILRDREDDYFDDFEHLGGAIAFQSYDGLQSYMTARLDTTWANDSDPNRDLWAS